MIILFFYIIKLMKFEIYKFNKCPLVLRTGFNINYEIFYNITPHTRGVDHVAVYPGVQRHTSISEGI